MLTRTMMTLTTLLASLALLSAAASGGTAACATAEQSSGMLELVMFDQVEFGGSSATVEQTEIPILCTAVPLAAGVLSAKNGTATSVGFYNSCDCDVGNRVTTVGPQLEDDNFDASATHFRAVT